MHTLTVALKVDFEQADEREATDFLSAIVEQIGRHTVAKRVVATISEHDKKLGHATWNESQNKLMVCTDTELKEVAANA